MPSRNFGQHLQRRADGQADGRAGGRASERLTDQSKAEFKLWRAASNFASNLDGIQNFPVSAKSRLACAASVLENDDGNDNGGRDLGSRRWWS